MIGERLRTKHPAAPGSIIALGAAAAAAAILVASASSDPAAALRAFFITPLSSRWFFGNTLDSAALLITAALGIVVAFRAGTFNLGGEGQIYAGGLAASAVLLFREGNGTITLFVAAAAGAGAGAILAAAAGALKARFGVDELISSFLLSSSVAPIADYLVSGPLRDPTNNLLATARFPHDRLLPGILEPSTLNLSAPIALLILVLAAFVLDGTATGFRTRVAGSSPAFARFAGMEPAAYWTPAFAASGALHGLTGFFAVAGTYGLCHRGFSGGLGWGAIAVALIARNAPFALIPAALAYSWLETGSETAMLTSELSFETAAFVQAAVFLLVTARFSGGYVERLRSLLPRGRK